MLSPDTAEDFTGPTARSVIGDGKEQVAHSEFFVSLTTYLQCLNVPVLVHVLNSYYFSSINPISFARSACNPYLGPFLDSDSFFRNLQYPI